jgi:hypothetical protein
MKTITGNIEIKRTEGKLNSISVVMPIWDKVAEDDFISVNIPLFGISTFAKNQLDIETAIRESISLFCINAEKFGKGLENELKFIGWSFENSNNMNFVISEKNRVFGQVMQTGAQFAEKLEIAC